MIEDNLTGRVIYEVDDIVKCIDDQPLMGNTIAPPIIIGDEYKIENITLDKESNQHLDLGFISMYNWIKSWETGEELSNGDRIHWVNPIRVEFVK